MASSPHGLHAGYAEVGEHDPPAALQQDIARLHIPVQHAYPVRRVERVHQLGADRRGLARIQRPALRQYVVERGPVDELHDDDGQAPLLRHVVHGDHAAVPDPGGGLRLPLHPEPQIGQFGSGGVGVGPQDLDGDLPVEQFVHRPGDDAHATAPDQRGHPVTPPSSAPTSSLPFASPAVTARPVP